MKKIITLFLLIILIILSLFSGVISNNKNNIIFDSPTNDKYTLAVFIYGEPANSFPNTKDYSATVECEHNGVEVSNVTGSASWNGTKWEVSVSNIEDGNVKCNVYFEEFSFHVGNLITLNLTPSALSSRWKTSTDGYDATTNNYLVSDTYTSSGTNTTFTNNITSWYIWDYYDNYLTLISAAPTTVDLKLNYAKGYNNALFFMNDIILNLYGGDGITARNINMVDILSKVFEYKKTVTSGGNTISLVDQNNRALTSIISDNSSTFQTVINELFDSTYGSDFSYSSANRYVPRTLYDVLNSSYTINFSTATELRDLEDQYIAVPTSNGYQRATTVKPLKWSYSITNFSNIIDSTTLSMLSSSSNYWIATRDYNFTNANNASVDYGVKMWTNNTIVPKAIYTSNITSGQTVSSAYLRPVLVIDLTAYEITSNNTLSPINS